MRRGARTSGEIQRVRVGQSLPKGHIGQRKTRHPCWNAHRGARHIHCACQRAKRAAAVMGAFSFMALAQIGELAARAEKRARLRVQGYRVCMHAVFKSQKDERKRESKRHQWERDTSESSQEHVTT